jgi:hypothetical protein
VGQPAFVKTRWAKQPSRAATCAAPTHEQQPNSSHTQNTFPALSAPVYVCGGAHFRSPLCVPRARGSLIMHLYNNYLNNAIVLSSYLGEIRGPGLKGSCVHSKKIQVVLIRVNIKALSYQCWDFYPSFDKELCMTFSKRRSTFNCKMA